VLRDPFLFVWHLIQDNEKISILSTHAATHGSHPCHLAGRHGSHGDGIRGGEKLHACAVSHHQTKSGHRGKSTATEICYSKQVYNHGSEAAVAAGSIQHLRTKSPRKCFLETAPVRRDLQKRVTEVGS
jgi:hypothetical protein